MSYQSINPYVGKAGKTFKEMSDSELETAIATAASCFESWRHTSFAERTAVVAKAATIMHSRVDEFARPVTLEMGKLFEQARGEVTLSADIIDYYAKNAEHFLAPERLKPASGEAQVESSPIGVLFGVEPWNFPYYQLARFAAPNLMAGNVVMVKHAGCLPQCALAFQKLWRDAGAPAGAYTNLFISYDQVNRVIDDPRIKGVALTGSVEAGKIVAGRAGVNLKKSTMELGGSDAFIVLDDADLEKTVKWAVWGKMNNTGQCCVAAKRFIVIDTLADRFLEQFKNALAALTPGDPMAAATTRLGLCRPKPLWSSYWTKSNGRSLAARRSSWAAAASIERVPLCSPLFLAISNRTIPRSEKSSSARSRCSLPSKTRTKRWHSPMTRNSVWVGASLRKTWHAANVWRAASIPA